MATDNLMTYEDVAEYLQVTVRHVKGLRADERIPYIKIGRQIRFRRAEIDAWIDDLSHPPCRH